MHRLEPLPSHMVQHGTPDPQDAWESSLLGESATNRPEEPHRLRQALHLVGMRTVWHQVCSQCTHNLLHSIHMIRRQVRNDFRRSLQHSAHSLAERNDMRIPRIIRCNRCARVHVERRRTGRCIYVAKIVVDAVVLWEVTAALVCDHGTLSCECVAHNVQIAADIIVPSVVMLRRRQQSIQCVEHRPDH